MSILIIEDDLDVRSAVADVLEEEGYRPLLAANGREALELLVHGARPSLILLDLMMPVMDGWEFHSRLLESPSLATTPIVVFTADGNAASKARKIAAAGYLRKPAAIGPLLDVVRRFCAPRAPPPPT
jgi:two-component system, chemotaxis family, chemotaxis protein CheY